MPFSEADSLAELGVSAGVSADVERSVLRKQLSKAAMGVATDLSSSQLQAASRALADIVRKERTAANKSGERCTPSYLDVQQGRAVLLQRLALWVASEESNPGSPFAPANLQRVDAAQSSAPSASFSNILAAPSAIRRGLATPGELLAASSAASAAPSAPSSSQAVGTARSRLSSIAQQVLGEAAPSDAVASSRAAAPPRARSAAAVAAGSPASAAPDSSDIQSISSSADSAPQSAGVASVTALCPACGVNLGVDISTAEGLQRMNAHLDRCVGGTSKRQAGVKRRRPPGAAGTAGPGTDSDSSLFAPEPTPRARASRGQPRSPGSAYKQSATHSRVPPVKSPRARLQGAGHMIIDDTDPYQFEQRVAEWYGEQFTVEEEHAAVGPIHDGTSKPLRSSMLSDDTQFRLGAALPSALVSKLFGYQRTGLRWLLELHAANTGGVLADEMGLGKTVQIVSLLGALHHAGVSYGPHLVVVPLTVLGHWVREFHAWYPALRVVVMHDSSRAAKMDGMAYNDMLDFALSKQRCTVHIPRRRFVQGQCVQDTTVCPAATRRIQLGAESTVVITTYHALRTRISELASVPWGYVVLDEAARIRNPAAAVTLAAKRLQSPHRIAMSGSPLQNSLSELWSLFDFVQPGKLGTQAAFEVQFGRPIAAGGWANASPVQSAKAVQCAMVLRDAIRPFLLRRMKLDVQASLPPKTEQVLFCGMTPHQLGLYRAFLQGDEVEAVLRGEALAFRVIGMLQKLCNHPALFEDAPAPPARSRMRGGGRQLQYSTAHLAAGRATKSERMRSGARAWHQSGKLAVAIRVLRTWADAGHKTLLFCQGTSMLDMFEGWLHTQPDMRYLRMDGTTSSNVRQSLIDQFNSDASVRVFLLTTRVGGIGVNLTGANRVLLFDPAWNPSVDAQARERAWRVGQAKPVTVYRLVTAGTVEERVYERQLWKTLLAQRVLSNPNATQSVDSSQLRQLLALDERKVVVRDTQADVKALAERGALKVRTQEYRSESGSSAQDTSDSECDAGPAVSRGARGGTRAAAAEATDSAVLDAMFNDGDLVHAVEKTAPTSAHLAAVPRSQRMAVHSAARAAAQVAQTSLAQTGNTTRIIAAQQAAKRAGQPPGRQQPRPPKRSRGVRALRIPTSMANVTQPGWQSEAARGTTLGLRLRARLSAAMPLPQVLGMDGRVRSAVSCHFMLAHQHACRAVFQVLPVPLYTAQGSLQHLRGLGARSTAAPRKQLAPRAGYSAPADTQLEEAGYFTATGSLGPLSLSGADVLASLRSLGMTQGLPGAALPGHARREAAAAAAIVTEAAAREDRHGRTFRGAADHVAHALQARAASLQAGPFLQRMQVAMDTAGGSMSTEEVVAAFGSSMPARALKRALRKHCEQQPGTGRWQLLAQYQAM